MAVEEPGLAVVSRQILVGNNTRPDRCFKRANANKVCNLTDFASFALKFILICISSYVALILDLFVLQTLVEEKAGSSSM